ncbi:Elongator complex protein 1 [Exophiala dermatitidis]|uniref:Elongator complex protein 1 n=1 Tax=Exophiala dermatitidis (strain ATCC 34100 / CBS 525.76 / NIH/UT8656) TaxID=858893 RepID=H6BTU5_EXODN|nr:elongator complex protein 1 [Exophiala dermatitidis NIH/UT8656]EHY55522.1 elongator complex protein 1 [Exophiala dermatitidis NIH/UT8656]
MRNLKTIAYDETRLKENLPLTATAWDAGTDTIICAFGPTPTQPVIELKRRHPTSSSEKDFMNITSWDAPCPLPDLECDEILLLQHFSDIATSCLVLAGGDVIVVREDPSPEQEKIEIVGSVDVGISAASWAPDEELLAIVTRADTLVLMSRNFEPLNEATLRPEDLKVSKHVSVGWGKKETQFQGKRAKAMRDPTMPETVDEGKPSPCENGKATVSWRGDGQYLAINSVVPDHRRVIRVFSREAVLDSASEPVDGMESALSWRPFGNLIAAIKRSDAKIEVIFFERNGLRHGQFELRLTKEEMDSWASEISLSWNNDSSVLAVSFKDRVQFWTMGNYHYYLKQEVQLHSHQSKAALRWHPETPLRSCFGASEYLLDLSFLSAVTRGSTVPPSDHGIVSVIDGKTLKLTPSKQSGVPPPMSFCDVPFGFNIVDSAVSRNGQKIAVLTTDTLELCQWVTRSTPKGELRFTANVQAHSIPLPRGGEDSQKPLRHTQVVLKDEDEVYILAPRQATQPATCHKLVWHDDLTTAQFEEVSVPSESQNLLLDVSFECVFCTDPSQDATSLLADGNSVEQTRLRGSQPNSCLFSLPVNASNGGLNGHGNRGGQQYHKVSLTPKGNLLVDDIILARECTSFILTSAHLIFTTSQHLLKFVHLAKPADMQVPKDTPEVDERCRNVERGAKIVTVIPSVYALILQMPRGNLETIYPRLLVLTGIRHHLKQQDYLAAFLACQTHQVDMNILHDYDPETFLANVPKFIDQLKKASRVDEFLSKLKDEDVTQTLYRDTLTLQPQSQAQPQLQSGTGPSPPNQPTSTNKVNKIADAFISALTSQPSPLSTEHLQNIITAHVTKRPPDLNSALTLVSSLRQTSEEEADLAVAHLCFLTDANRLFDAALALYDLDLTLLVAQNAQRDPREYMPFLQSLQDLPVLRRRFQIDNHLKRYSKALVSLHALEAHDEVTTYTVKHNLYTVAMDLYKYDRAHLDAMTRLYAEHLANLSQHNSAATLFESLGDYEAAYPLYALAPNKWREALFCASLVQPPLEKNKVHSLAASLATNCADVSRDYRAAATITMEYLDDVPAAARLLCKGSYFADAMRILAMRPTLVPEIPTIVDSGLTEKFGEILELVADCKAQLNAQIPRIQELRKKKEEDPLAFYGGDPSLMSAAEGGAGVDIPDNISLAATDASTLGGQSLFTRYGSNASKFGGTVASNVSRKTSKTKRREERKRARGKKGSVYEEEYLVASVGRLIERVNGVHDEVKRLISGLLRRGMRDQAAKVDEVLKDVCEQCSKARLEVWQLPQPDVVQPDNVYDVQGEGRPPGADGVFWESQQETMKPKEAPEVKSWAASDLLASQLPR